MTDNANELIKLRAILHVQVRVNLQTFWSLSTMYVKVISQ